MNRAISERRELNEDEGRVYGDMMKMALSFCRELYFAVACFPGKSALFSTCC